MPLDVSTQLLDFSRRIAAIAQSGLYYCKDKYDEDRYKQLQVIASEIIGIISDMPCAEIHEIISMETGHATPKVDVRGACFDKNGHILLVKEMSDECWSLPGGWAEVGLSPQESLIKEMREEAALDVEVTGIVGIFNEEIEGVKKRLFHEYKIIFSCQISGPVQKGDAPDEILEVGYFPENALPPLSRTRTSPQQVRECFKNHG